MQDVTRGGDFVFHGTCSEGYFCSVFAVRAKDERIAIPVERFLVKTYISLDPQTVAECAILGSDLASLPELKAR
jgi:hypothetical protein